ncbi:EVE domain-containing protein [Neobacillus drentensis]|uniref:EVE domain-containing protein n=1 Tax=Neobacillus drentensis TaxID=220684 RepID=UPI0030008FA4
MLLEKSQTRKHRNTWIFQGNPDDFKIDKYISENNEIWWSLNQQHFLDEISEGDVVYIWRSDGKKRGTGGIIARGTINGEPSLNISPSKYWIKKPEDNEKFLIPITIENHLVNGHLIRRAELKEHPKLNELLILRMANNTNYLVKDEHAKIIQKLWEKYTKLHTKQMRRNDLKDTVRNDLEADKAQFDSFYKEGEIKSYYGNRYERKAKNRLRAIEIHGTKCAVCGFNFEEVYGEHGKDFIEVHHKNPLCAFEAATEIDPRSDLVPVCSNCHRMLHRDRDHVLSVEELKTMIKK